MWADPTPSLANRINCDWPAQTLSGPLKVLSTGLARPLLIHAKNFTLFIKNTVTFSKFNFSKTNALDTWDSAYFKHCRYDALSNPYCPVFGIGDLIAAAGGDFEDLALL
ncbi:Hypothetical predicted protein, partial [Marmota monax]